MCAQSRPSRSERGVWPCQYGQKSPPSLRNPALFPPKTIYSAIGSFQPQILFQLHNRLNTRLFSNKRRDSQSAFSIFTSPSRARITTVSTRPFANATRIPLPSSTVSKRGGAQPLSAAPEPTKTSARPLGNLQKDLFIAKAFSERFMIAA